MDYYFDSLYIRITFRELSGTAYKTDIYIEDYGPVKELVKFAKESDWNAAFDYKLVIFRVEHTGEYGYFEEIPDGYSTMTYDPEKTLEILKGSQDFKKFCELCLTMEHREMLASNREFADLTLRTIIDED